MKRLHCPVATACGGCPNIDLAWQAQRVNKEAQVRAALGPLLRSQSAVCWLYHDAPEGYRNRIRMRVVAGVPAFFNPHKSPECAVLEPPLRAAVERVRDWAASQQPALSAIEHLEVRAPDRHGSAGLVLAPYAVVPQSSVSPTSGPQSPFGEGALAGRGPADFTVHVLGEGSPAWQCFDLLDGVYGYVPLGSFRQVNAAVNRSMLACLRDLALELECRSFSDLFCGSGNTSLPLLAAGLDGAGVEIDERAITALRAAASEQGLRGDGFVAADITQLPESVIANLCGRDLLVMDPPRAGLRKEVDLVPRLRSAHVVLWYCKVESFARDAAQLAHRGFVLERLWLCDMFPHTGHVELMAYFRAA